MSGEEEILEEDEVIAYKILVVGAGHSGKSSLIHRIVDNQFSNDYIPTLGIDFLVKEIVVDNRKVRAHLWDIAGQERFSSMTRVYYQKAVGAFVVFDVSDPNTFDKISEWKEDIDNKVTWSDGRPIPVVLLANKCDMPKEMFCKSDAEIAAVAKEFNFISWFYTSAKNKENRGVWDALNLLISTIVTNDVQPEPAPAPMPNPTPSPKRSFSMRRRGPTTDADAPPSMYRTSSSVYGTYSAAEDSSSNTHNGSATYYATARGTPVQDPRPGGGSNTQQRGRGRDGGGGGGDSGHYGRPEQRAYSADDGDSGSGYDEDDGGSGEEPTFEQRERRMGGGVSFEDQEEELMKRGGGGGGGAERRGGGSRGRGGGGGSGPGAATFLEDLDPRSPGYGRGGSGSGSGSGQFFNQTNTQISSSSPLQQQQQPRPQSQSQSRTQLMGGTTFSPSSTLANQVNSTRYAINSPLPASSTSKPLSLTSPLASGSRPTVLSKALDDVAALLRQLRLFDPNNTGLVTGAQFKDACTKLNLLIGTRQMDKILASVKLNGNGTVSYEGLNNEVAKLIREVNASPSVPDGSDLYRVRPSNIREDVSLETSHLPEERLLAKERFIANQERISQILEDYEHRRIDRNGVMASLDAMGFTYNIVDMHRVLRKMEEEGRCSFSALVNALCMTPFPESELALRDAKTVFNAQMHTESPVKMNPASPPHLKPRPYRDTNPLTWNTEPVEATFSPRTCISPRAMTKELSKWEAASQVQDPTFVRLKHEKVSALVRQYLSNTITHVKFRQQLRELDVVINEELEHLIQSHDQTGRQSYRDFMRVFHQQQEGVTQFEFQREELPPTRRQTSIIAWDGPGDKLPPPVIRKPAYTSFDLITGNKPGDGIVPPRKQLSHSATATQLTPSITGLTSNQPSDMRPCSRQYRENDQRASSIQATARGMVPQEEDTYERPPAIVEPNHLDLLKWKAQDNPPVYTPIPSQPARNSQIDDMYGSEPYLHPKAPFGTDRDKYYDVNPHFPYANRTKHFT
ncbi:Ras family protein [Pelomyxa schiedti]|nr:Ras family protein [Pelomyxa schiedti]